MRDLEVIAIVLITRKSKGGELLRALSRVREMLAHEAVQKQLFDFV